MYLHSNSTQILALKKTGFFTFSDSKKNFQNFFYKIIMQLFSADAIVKDTIYTKLALMPWIDDNLGHTLSVLTQIGNIIAKIFWK